MLQEKSKWESDAGNISNFENFNALVYENGIVTSFLKDSNKSFIIAAKGMGKTLMLSYKRYILEGRNGSSIIFIPNQQPYIGFIESVKYTLSNEHINKLKDWEYCKRLWVLVIELCALSYTNSNDNVDFSKVSPQVLKYKRMLSDLISEPNTIEYIFNEIISQNETALARMIDDVSNYIGKCFKHINQGIVIFLDRFDNALETSHDDIWIPIQAGLLEAAWDVMRNNHHIKIYLSIRQEAYAAHTSRNSNAISSSVVKIQYSKSELRDLVNHLVYYYEGFDSIEQFLGFETFPNTITFQDEDVFDFMFRYSIGRPRDFVQFCGELSEWRNSYTDLNTKGMELKDKIRAVSSQTIIGSLFEELRMLLNCFTSIETFKEFLILLRHNVLTYDELKTICKSFNKNNCKGDCSKCPPTMHPFCDLFNMGLLGFVEEDGYDRKKQKFKTPYENLTHGLRGNVEFFLIHPALREYINVLNRSSSIDANYTLYKGILVGSGLPWTNKDTDLFNVNRIISELESENLRLLFDDILKKFLQDKVDNFDFVDAGRVIETSPLYIRKRLYSVINYYNTKEYVMPEPISIFVSYAYDNEIHKEKVVSFVEMLRVMGFNAQMDSMLKNEYPDIDQLMAYGLSLDKVIVVLSPEYKRKADSYEGGVWKEFKMIANDLEKHPQKYIFVSFDLITNEIKEKILPIRIGNRWIVDLEKGKQDNYNELVAFIKEEKEYPFSAVNNTDVSVKPKTIKPF